MKVTDTMTVELTLVYDVKDTDQVKEKNDYENMLKNTKFDDVHVKNLKHFISEVER